jgi:hypothetical protein
MKRFVFRAWLVLIVLDVVVWLIADSQGPDLLAFNAHGTFLTVLEVAWVVSLLVFIVLVLVGVAALARTTQRRARRAIREPAP